MTIPHGPDFLADRLGEVARVSDDEHTTLERLECTDESGERLAIEIVGRLVQGEDVGTTPGGGTKDDLDLLTARQAPHGVVRDKLGFKTEVGKVLLNLLADKRAKQAETLGFTGINLQNTLLETTLDEIVARHPDVFRGREALERDLVLVRLLELLAVVNLVDDALLTINDNVRALLHLLDLLRCQLLVDLHHLLEILSGLITPEHVLERSLVEVLLNVVERVLGDITDDKVGMLPDFTALVRLHVSDEELDEGRFTGSVRTKNSDTRREGDLKGDIVELLLSLGGILEADLAHLEERLLLGLDTVEEGGIREGKLIVLSGLESVVRLGLRDDLDKGLKIATVTLDLEAIEMENVCDGVVEESRVVRDDD